MESSPDTSVDLRPSTLLSEALSGQLKMKQLNDKLVNIQSSLEVEKEARMSSYQDKLKTLDGHLTRLKISDDTRHVSLKDNLTKLQESILVHHSDRDRLDERRTKEGKLVSTNFTIDLGLEKQNRRESEAKLLKTIEEKMLNVKLDVANERKIREEAGSQRLLELAERLGQIQSEVDAEALAREAAFERITTAWSEGVDEFYQQMAEEARQWDFAKEGLIHAIEEMASTVRTELEKERKEREAIEERLIGLLEETCSRVEQGLSYSPFL